MRRIQALCCMATLLLVAVSAAGQSTGWRGNRTGRYPDSQVPLQWDEKTNILWTCELPKWGNATPVIIGDRIFVTAEPDLVICISKDDGRILWQKSMSYSDTLTPEQRAQAEKDRIEAKPIEAELHKLQREARKVGRQLRKDRGNAELKKRMQQLRGSIKPLQAKLEPLKKFQLPKTHPTNGYTSHTPVTDGKNLYVLFGTGVAGCFTPEGQVKWMRHVQKPNHGWGHSASPVFVDGKLILHILDLFALDPTNGETLWTTQTKSIWGTAVETTIGNTPVVLTPQGAIVRAADGNIVGTVPMKLEYNAPIIDERTVYYIQNGGGAIELPEQASDRIRPRVLWKTQPKKERYYASPVLHDGLIYCITRFLDFSVIDAQDGKVLYEKKLDQLKKDKGDQAYPSPLVVNGHVLISADSGRTLVLKPGREYNEVRINQLPTFRSTPVVEGSRMYIRTYPALYCIGTK